MDDFDSMRHGAAQDKAPTLLIPEVIDA